MTGQFQLGDLDLAALISSRICHDVISPVGAISNGLEVLDEENDEQVREYALDLIRRSADQASAKLQFARIAFGAAGSAGSEIGLPMIEGIARGILDPDKHTLELTSEPASLIKNQTCESLAPVMIHQIHLRCNCAKKRRQRDYNSLLA